MIAVWAAILVMFYGVLIQFWQPPVDFGQNQWANNRIHIESFVYGRPRSGTIVGSSMAATLPADQLGPDLTNLALAGGSSLTGLALISHLSSPPQQVFIEINVLDRGLDQTLIDHVFAWPLFDVRRVIAALRVTYQPINLLFWQLRRLRYANEPSNQIHALVTPEMQQALLEMQQKSYAHPPNAQLLKANLESLAVSVQRLEAQGSRVVLFEMPTDPSLTEAPYMIATRQALSQVLPHKMLCRLDHPGQELQTGDGIHLTQDSARLVAQRFKSVLTQCF